MADETQLEQKKDELEDKTVSELEKKADRLQVPVTGTGSGGNVVKHDLVDALAAVEAGPKDTSGRPPLADVAVERVANRNVRVISTQEED